MHSAKKACNHEISAFPSLHVIIRENGSLQLSWFTKWPQLDEDHDLVSQCGTEAKVKENFSGIFKASYLTNPLSV